MASITAKKIKGHTYYYARVCKRVDGKPKIVWQKYLGKAEDIIARSDGVVPEPKEVILSEFGAVAALLSLVDRLGVVDIINRNTGKRNQGVSIGEYLMIAAVARSKSPVEQEGDRRLVLSNDSSPALSRYPRNRTLPASGSGTTWTW